MKLYLDDDSADALLVALLIRDGHDCQMSRMPTSQRLWSDSPQPWHGVKRVMHREPDRSRV